MTLKAFWVERSDAKVSTTCGSSSNQVGSTLVCSKFETLHRGQLPAMDTVGQLVHGWLIKQGAFTGSIIEPFGARKFETCPGWGAKPPYRALTRLSRFLF